MALVRWLNLRSKQVLYAVLSRVCGFDSWHYLVVRENCGYFRKVKALHESLNPSVTIEIGCGLGEVVSGLRSEVLIGIDREPAVIQAARLVHGRAARFFSLSNCPGKEAYAAQQGRVCLVFLNWFHAVTADEVRKQVRGHVARFRPTHVIFDVIDQHATSYQYRHDPQLLREFGRTTVVIDAGDRTRSLVVLEIADPGSNGL